MATVAEFPYDDYYLYIVFHKKEERKYACLVPIKKGVLKRRTISYARYLMSVKEKRILKPEEHVDHIDNDKTNDVIENLQILSLKENNVKASKVKGKVMVELKCPACGKIFNKPKRETFLSKKGQTFSACSRHCASQIGAFISAHKNMEEINKKIQENVIRVWISCSEE